MIILRNSWGGERVSERLFASFRQEMNAIRKLGEMGKLNTSALEHGTEAAIKRTQEAVKLNRQERFKKLVEERRRIKESLGIPNKTPQNTNFYLPDGSVKVLGKSRKLTAGQHNKLYEGYNNLMNQYGTTGHQTIIPNQKKQSWLRSLFNKKKKLPTNNSDSMISSVTLDSMNSSANPIIRGAAIPNVNPGFGIRNMPLANKTPLY